MDIKPKEIDEIRYKLGLTMLSTIIMVMSVFMLGMTMENMYWFAGLFGLTTWIGYFLMMRNWDVTKNKLIRIKQKVE